MRVIADRMALIWDKEMVPNLRQFQIDVARQVLAEEQARGFDRNPRIIVDRRHDAPVESVKFAGRIEYAARSAIDDIVAEVYAELVELSPVLSGDYRDAHLVMVNGASIDYRPGQPLNLKDGDRVQIVNTQPYARKIEGGGSVVHRWHGRRKRRRGQMLRITRSSDALSPQAPNGVYRVVWRRARDRFGAVAFVDFKWVKIEGGLSVRARWAQGTKHNGRVAQNYPSIQIYQTAAARGDAGAAGGEA